ncbi:DegT/DnrJ/EryC1/StrS family aminotransferase [Seleniivibrio woodruffii]|uniref:UDP-2-acetamido-2-deoxy-ribo-hexuluronate aminotransferase n=1 Tax=Seleniivibrio woodruffii TaxID=1078050 RepID=A0A4R1KE27_9BACT|nr:DegT/DnrJ/EryC1/StrS family aminotransferase [Seleniivibrio woodruffii]TCK62367.1 UDP-2-acetamido-2-deoxy-ribo-hexuluronate aminotransferase [Seleniivibrio woodruffii]TVZ34516.1 UDP-2-acetamido-2-deoxy-ribo-hexuluronate aminotransferase [Seleniivibrio woodruffii]
MKMNFIDLQAQYKKYKDEIDTQIHQVLDTSSYILGPKVAELEKNLAEFTGVKHAIACSSGTDALLLALMALDVKPGDEVITSPFTFIATAEMIAFVGAVPVFVDIEDKTYNIDPAKIEEKITSKTKAIMPVSIFGQTPDMDAINAIGKKHNIPVIEDGAQSFGALYKGKRSCGMSEIGCTSFFPAKPLGCYGDGGAIFTNCDELNAKMRILLNHGQTERYVHSHVGINGRLDAVQAGVLNVKLKYYNEEIEVRQAVAKRYAEGLKNVVVPFVEKDNVSVWAQYCIRVNDRDAMIKKCSDAGVPTAVYYPIPLHLQKVFAYLGHKEGDFPVTETVSKDIMALPMSAFLKEDEQKFVIETVNS